MKTFAGIESELATYESSQILLQPVPYDGTSTWGKGADRGFDEFIVASENMEVYDIETDSEVYRRGIHLLPELKGFASPEDMYEAVYRRTTELLASGKFLTFFGGEHSISIGIIEAFREHYPDITVLQLDAHADLRKEYLGTEFNHACALHKASMNTNLVQVGIRSMDSCETEYINKQKCVFADEIARDNAWMEKSLGLMTDRVYITLDLDVLDPSVMPATGTPEPGGINWYTLISYLKMVFQSREVVGFDIVEFAPVDGLSHPGFLVSKLYYKLLSYKYSYGR